MMFQTIYGEHFLQSSGLCSSKPSRVICDQSLCLELQADLAAPMQPLLPRSTYSVMLLPLWLEGMRYFSAQHLRSLICGFLPKNYH